MKKYDAQSIRNVCLLSHGGVGKTTLVEAACFASGATKKQGKVDDGSSIFDTRADEKDRKMTISMALGAIEWKDTKINLLDTPGFLDLLGDAKAALQVVESALVLVDATAGIQVGTELVSNLVNDSDVARIFFVNGMNKENANFDRVVDELKETFGTSVAPLQLPIGTGNSFKGVVNLLSQEAFEYADGSGKGKKIDIPSELADTVASARSALMEAIAESDEELMEKYFEEGELSEEEMNQGLAKGAAAGLVFPLLCGSASLNAGTDLLLDALVTICPSADQRPTVRIEEGGEVKKVSPKEVGTNTAFVFKTISEEHVGELNIVRVFNGSVSNSGDCQNITQNVSERIGNISFMLGNQRIETTEIPTGDIGGLLKLKDTHTNNTLSDKGASISIAKIPFDEPLVKLAISAKNKGDDDKIAAGLKKLQEEDPTFSYNYHSDIRQSILSTMGDHHTEIILDNLKRRFKIEVEREKPKISYRETVTKPVKYVEYTHKKQTGGAGQYARVFIDLEPTDRGEGYEFIDKIVGGVIDQPLRPSVDKGIKAKMIEGIVAGYPIVDVRVSLVDGKTHPVDSKDVAFQIAGREVFKKAFEMASPILLEPIVDMTVTVPEEYMGDVMGDLSSRRGKIGGMDAKGKFQVINAKVPEAEVQNYSQTLRSLTQGRGLYTKSFSHYDPVPHEVTQKVVEESNAQKEEG